MNALILALIQLSWGQDGLDAHGLTVAPQRDAVHSGLSVRTPTRFDAGDWYVASVFEYARELVVLEQQFTDGTSSRTLALGRAGFVDLSAGVAVHRRLQLDVSMPVVPFSTGLDGPNGFRVGDLRVGATVPVWVPSEERGFGLSVDPWVTVPTGDAGSLLGDVGVGGGAAVSAVYRYDRWTFGGSGGYVVRPDVKVKNLLGADQLTAAVSAGVAPVDAWGVTAELHAATSLVGGMVPPVEARLVSRNAVGRGLSVVYGGGVGLTQGIGAADLRAFAGVAFSPAPRPEPVVVPIQTVVPEVVPEVAAPVVAVAPPPPPEPRFLGVVRPVHFATGSAVIAAWDHPALDAMAEVIVADGITVEIAGHTDSEGSGNQALSERRAAAVVAYLVGRGVRPEQLVARGYAQTEPASDNDTERGRWNNRRVELRLIDR